MYCIIWLPLPFVPPQILGIFNVAILQLLCSLNVVPLLFLCLYIGYTLFEMLFFCAHPASALWYFGNFYSFFIFSGNSFWTSLVWLSCPLLCFLCTLGREPVLINRILQFLLLYWLLVIYIIGCLVIDCSLLRVGMSCLCVPRSVGGECSVNV